MTGSNEDNYNNATNNIQVCLKGARKQVGVVWIGIFFFIGLSFILYRGVIHSITDFSFVEDNQNNHNKQNYHRLAKNATALENVTTQRLSMMNASDVKGINNNDTTTTTISDATNNIPQMSPVHVLFGLSGNNEGFLAEFEVALKSVLMNAPMDSEMNVHIIADNDAFGALGTIFERTELRTWKTRNPTSIHTYNITSLLPSWRDKVLKTLDFTSAGGAFGVHTIGCFFRLFAHDVLPATVNHVLYLDTDVIIMANLAEVWKLVNHTAAFQWGIGMCSGFVLMNVHRMDDIWDLASKSPLANISREYNHIGDQLIFMAVNITFPNEISILPDGWDMTVTERWRPKYRPIDKKFPNVGMLHMNGGGSSTGAYFETHSFFNDNYTWGNGKYYATMPWTWARFRAEATIPLGHDGYSLVVNHTTIS